MAIKWDNRIVGEGEESPDQLQANPNNWRIHSFEQQETMKAILNTVGWVQRIVINKRTQNVIDGHMRVAIALSEGLETVPVIYVDLTEEEEKIILSTFDAISAQAITDPEAYKTLLEDIVIDDDYLNDLVNSQIENVDYLSYDTGLDKSLDELPKSQIVSTTYSLQIAFDSEEDKQDFAHTLSTQAAEAGFDYAGEYIKSLIHG